MSDRPDRDDVSPPAVDRPRRPHDARGAAAVAAVAVLLGAVPEWAKPGFYFHDDMQTQYVPVARFVGRSWLAGSVPLVNDASWFGGAVAGEYQHGVFSVFHSLLCALLAALQASPAHTAAWLAVTYFGVSAAGTYLLARDEALGPAESTCAALVASLNGYSVVWSSWIVGVAGVAWIPWYWWSLRRLVRSPRPDGPRIAAVAAFSYLIFAAGWHFAALTMALVTAYVLLAETPRPRRKPALAAAAGMGLASPALLCFLEYVHASHRSDFDARSWAWSVPPLALGGLFLPESSTTWPVFGAPAAHENIELANGVVPTLLVCAGFARAPGDAWRKYRSLTLFAAFVLLLAVSPSLTRARWSFRWLPLFHLLCGLLAAHLLADRRSAAPGARSRRSCVGLWALFGVAAAAVVGPPPASSWGHAGAVAAVLAATALMEALTRQRPATAAWGFAAATAAGLAIAPLWKPPRTSTPEWDFTGCSAAASLLRPEDRALGLYTFADVIRPAWPGTTGRNACVLPGNTPMLADRPYVNGYSLLLPYGMTHVLGLSSHGEVDRGLARIVLDYAGPGALLDRLGVTALVVPNELGDVPVRAALADAGWTDHAEAAGVAVLRRGGQGEPPALLSALSRAHRFASVEAARSDLERGGPDAVVVGPSPDPDGTAASFAPVAVALENVAPASVDALVRVPSGDRPGYVVLRRPYYAGYRATLDGRALPVSREDGILVGVELPPGSNGRLRVAYVPLGMRAGVPLALMAFLVVAGFAAGRFRFATRTRRATGSMAG